MDINVGYVVKALAINLAFSASLAIAFTLIFSLLLKKEEKPAAIKAAWCVIIIAAFCYTCGISYIHFPTVDELASNVFVPLVAPQTQQRVEQVKPSVVKEEGDVPAEKDLEESSGEAKAETEDEPEQRLWGEGTPRGRRGHIDDKDL